MAWSFELGSINLQIENGTNMAKHNFKKLEIWMAGLEISKMIYTLTDKFPQREQFALTTQLNKSGVSIPSNIAEGSFRTTNKEFSRFIDISLGSSAEAETQLVIAEWRGYITSIQLRNVLDKIDSFQKRTIVFKENLKRKQ